jgi:hypothetical protein
LGNGIRQNDAFGCEKEGAESIIVILDVIEISADLFDFPTRFIGRESSCPGTQDNNYNGYKYGDVLHLFPLSTNLMRAIIEDCYVTLACTMNRKLFIS